MKPGLVVMAAGMGSRFGGLKQLEPVGPNGERVMDYALYDAKRAGVDRVVFVIRKAFEREFHEQVGSRYSGWMDVVYAFQELEQLPRGFTLPPGRVKPWGRPAAGGGDGLGALPSRRSLMSCQRWKGSFSTR